MKKLNSLYNIAITSTWASLFLSVNYSLADTRIKLGIGTTCRQVQVLNLAGHIDVSTDGTHTPQKQQLKTQQIMCKYGPSIDFEISSNGSLQYMLGLNFTLLNLRRSAVLRDKGKLFDDTRPSLFVNASKEIILYSMADDTDKSRLSALLFNPIVNFSGKLGIRLNANALHVGIHALGGGSLYNIRSSKNTSAKAPITFDNIKNTEDLQGVLIGKYNDETLPTYSYMTTPFIGLGTDIGIAAISSNIFKIGINLSYSLNYTFFNSFAIISEQNEVRNQSEIRNKIKDFSSSYKAGVAKFLLDNTKGMIGKEEYKPGMDLDYYSIKNLYNTIAFSHNIGISLQISF